MGTKVNLRNELDEARIQTESEINLKISDTKLLLSENEAKKIAVLTALGLDEDIKEYTEAKGKSLDRKKVEDEFGKDVFHSDEIKALCMKYDLKFLESRYYNGNITAALPEKVIEFADKHKLRLGTNNDTWNGDGGNFYILGPREKFKENRTKEERRVDDDPILFYFTKHNHYKMVYAWGNSLSMYRLIKGWKRRSIGNRYAYFVIMFLLFSVPVIGWLGASLWLSLLLGGIFSFGLSLAFIPWDNGPDYKNHFFSKYGWDKQKTNFSV